MTNKKIIRNPTPESSPFLYYGHDSYHKDHDSIIDLLFLTKNYDSKMIEHIENDYLYSLSPVSFDDFKIMENLKEKYHSMKPELSLIGKISHFISKMNIATALTILLGATLLILFNSLITIWSIFYYIENNILTYALVIIATIITLITIISGWTYIYNLDQYIDYKVNFDKKDKELLQNKIFLDASSYENQEDHKNTINSIVNAFDYINNTNHSDSIDLYNVKSLYNEYILLLSFTLNNKDKISQELYDDYIQQLKELSQKIVKESGNIVTIIKEKEEYIEKHKEELDNINQEIIDNEAITIFPRKNSQLLRK